MARSIKIIKGNEYVYESVWNPTTKRNEYKCLGNVKHLPEVIDSRVTLSFPCKAELIQQLNDDSLISMFEHFEIDKVLSALVISINKYFIRYGSIGHSSIF